MKKFTKLDDQKVKQASVNDFDGLNTKRRNLIKLGLGLGVVASVSQQTSKAADEVLPPPLIIPPSPPVLAWQEQIPEYCYRAKTTVENFYPPTQAAANIEGGECGRDPIQRFDDFYPVGDENHDYYELRVSEQPHSFNPAYPIQSIWGYDGLFPGPTIHARYGRPVMLRLYNELPEDHVGFGSPEISMHLHNMHTSSESDGFPGDYWSNSVVGPTMSAPGSFKDHCYYNVYAGFDKSRETDPSSIGDPREALGTLWYHDHALDITAANCVKGLVGSWLMFDEIDSGNESDTNPAALRLPSGDYDVPLMLVDMRFKPDGTLFFDQMSPEGFVGDMVAVNGKIKPFFNVARRKYRLRFINGGPTRYYGLSVIHKGKLQKFAYIANDGNLLEAPLMDQTRVNLAMAERGDIVIDFSTFPVGSELFLINRVRQDDTRKPDKILEINESAQILKFIVNRNPAEPDNSRILTASTPLRALPPIDLSLVRTRRKFLFGRKNGVWTINDQIFDITKGPRFNSKNGQPEIWTLINEGGGWEHPIHIHLEEGRILKRNGKAPPLHERGRKDVYNLRPGETIEIYINFRDFPGKYVMHCHNLVHEDHAMMIRFDVKD